MTRIVFVHGRQQQDKDAGAEKRLWMEALKRGLNAAGIDMPLRDDDARFAYYGNALHALETRAPEVDVIVRGDAAGDSPQSRSEGAADVTVGDELIVLSGREEAFIADVLEAYADAVPPASDMPPALEDPVIERSLANHPRVLRALRWLDHQYPEVGGPILFLRTRDVWMYITNARIHSLIDQGVRDALSGDEPNIVVSHSLGTVVAHSILSERAERPRWQVPLLVTLGSPLGVAKVRESLPRVSFPESVDRWLNAFDPLDVVALNPLDRTNFPTVRPIDNYAQVENPSADHHSIEGYLADAYVAEQIHATWQSTTAATEER